MKYLLGLIILFSISVQAQKKVKFGKPYQEDFSYSQCDFEPNANAVILYEEGELNVGYEMASIDVFRRIKILNKDGIEEANIEIPYYYGSRHVENIVNLKAVTINHENGTTKTVELDKDDFYTVDINEYYKAVRFAFPDVKPGSILDLKYRFTTQNLYFLDSWEFQHEIPTERSQFKASVNAPIDYTTLLQGTKLVKLAKKDKSASSYKLQDIPSISDITHVYNRKDNLEKISFQVSSVNGYSEISSWKNLIKDKLRDLKDNKRNSALRTVSEQIPTVSNEREQVEEIVKYFNQNFSWNEFYGQYPRRNLNQIIKEKKGNLADLNYLFYLVASEKRLNTELVMLSTRYNGKIIVSYPYLGQFNALLNSITFKEGGNIMLDAAQVNKEQLSFFPLEHANKYGLLLNEKANFIIINQPLSKYDFKQEYKVEDDGMVSFNYSNKWSGYFDDNRSLNENLKSALDIQFDVKKEKEVAYKDGNYIQVTSYQSDSELSNINLISNPLLEKLSEFQLKNEERTYDIEFDFPFYIKGTIIMDLPEGYQATLPKKLVLKVGEDLVYAQKSTQMKGKIIWVIELLIRKPIYTIEEYENVKKFFTDALSNAQEKVIIKKET